MTQDSAAEKEALLHRIVAEVPYITYLGVSFDIRGDELTGHLSFDKKLIGNPMLPALHGGVTSAFLEITAHVTLTWHMIWTAQDPLPEPVALPKTIDFSLDYLRSGQARDAYARARINRSGRRYASVHVEGWQETRGKLFAQATGHFLMPQLK